MTYDGNVSELNLFKDTFIRTMVIQKELYLASMHMIDENYDRAWEILTQKFDRRRKRVV